MLFLFLSFIFGISAQNSNDTTITNTACANKTIKNPVTFVMQPEEPKVGQGTDRMTVDLKELYNLKQTLELNSESHRKPRTSIFLGVQLNTELIKVLGSEVKSYTKSFSSYNISDSTEATIVALGITSENAQDYKYHVVENDSVEIVPWSPIPKIVHDIELQKQFGQASSTKEMFTYANLGTYLSPGKQILIEVVNKNDYSIRDGIILDWRMNFKPVVTQIIVKTNSSNFNLNFPELNRNYATEFDPQTGMPENLVFPKDSIQGFRFTFKEHLTVPYRMFLIRTLNQKTYASEIVYYLMDKEFDFFNSNFKEPGDYVLIIEPVQLITGKYDEAWRLSFKFKVLPPPLKAKTFSFIQVAGWGSVILLLLAFIFTGYYTFNKRKLLKARQQKELTRLKLKSIQSQLNPHFMFNALSSIQNLMNKNDIEGANRYLGKFSGLTRKVLDSSDAEMISLEDELQILEDYIQMEQLRFGFMHEIKTGEKINTTNIEVPAMLLQPFVENAVKHGVSALNKDGMIRILASSVQNDLILQVVDNGAGFSEESINGNSKGIKLVKERIALLNQSFGNETIELKINSGENGTTVILKLKNWV
jgi:hypothetical protein